MELINRADIQAIWCQARDAGLIDPAEDTALIFLDFAVIEDRLRALTSAFPADTLHAVAIKTNPLGAVLRYVASTGAGLEAASFNEVHMARAAGLTGEHIVFDSPAKTTREIARLIEAFPGVRVNGEHITSITV